MIRKNRYKGKRHAGIQSRCFNQAELLNVVNVVKLLGLHLSETSEQSCF